MSKRALTMNQWTLLIAAAAFAVGVIVIVTSVRSTLRDYALSEAASQARLIAARNLSIHEYFSGEIKPAVFETLESVDATATFEPSWMSSTYAVREIDLRCNELLGGSDYYFKDAAVNARSPENEADALEAEFIRRLDADPDSEEVSEVVEIDGVPFFIVMRKGEVMAESCLRCHGDPADAPAGLVDIYGPSRSFGREVGDVVSVVSVRIPLVAAYAEADKATGSLVGIILILMVTTAATVFVANRYTVTGPLGVITRQAAAIAGDEARLGERIEPRGPVETRRLTDAFNAMSERLATTIAELEESVSESTDDLERMNESLLEEVAEREIAEEALGQQRDFAESIVETANVLVIALDARGRITIFNRHAERVTGFRRADVEGESLVERLCPPSMVDAVREEWDTHFDPSRPGFRPVECRELRFPVMTSSGDERAIEWRCSSLRAIGGETGTICVGVDITDAIAQQAELDHYRTQLEELVNQRTRQLVEANEELLHATQIKDSFLARMSHELRTPLNSIIGFSSIMLRGLAGPVGEEQAKQLGMIQDSGTYLLGLVDEILDLSRVGSGVTVIECAPVDAAEIVHAVVDSLVPVADAKGITIERLVPETIEMVTDERRLRQILTNLIGNAVKFTERGLVSVTARGYDERVRIVVSDTGPGIAEDDLGKVFDPFWQQGELYEATGGGAGLGLPIALRLAELLGGTIEVESVVDAGSVFTLWLPLHTPCGDDAEMVE